MRLGSFGIIDPGDGYFAEASREMLERGDFVTPHLNYQIYFSKPILIYWLISSAYYAFGVSEMAARLWPAALATALVISTYWVTRCLAGARAGLLAGLILVSSPLVVTFARLSMVDMPFTSFLGIAVCALVMTVVVGSRRWWPVIYAALALSVLTKGPAGLVLFGLGVLAFLAVGRPSKQRLIGWIKQLEPGWGSLIFLAITVPWHVAVGLATRGLFLQVFYLYENLGRFEGHVNHAHEELWYYLPVLAYGFFPWVMFLPEALKRAFPGRESKPVWESKQAAGLLLMACWILTVLVFFTLSRTKLQTYILPCFAAMAVIIAVTLEGWLGTAQANRRPPRSLGILSPILALLGLAAACAGPIAAVTVKHIDLWMRLVAALSGLCLGVGWIYQFMLLRRQQFERSLWCLLSTSTVVCALVTPVAFELGYRYRDADLREVIRCIPRHHSKVAIYQDFKPSIMFYLRRPVDSFFSPDWLVKVDDPHANAQPRQFVITSQKADRDLIAAHGGRLSLVASKGSWRVYETVRLSLLPLPTLEQTFKYRLNMSTNKYSWGTLPFAGGPWPVRKQAAGRSEVTDNRTERPDQQ